MILDEAKHAPFVLNSSSRKQIIAHLTLSFDLDDTLIPGVKQFRTEKQSRLQRLLGIEKIRSGTITLFRKLREDGHTLGIYTTSYRSKAKIKLTFFTYGIPVKFVVNQQSHNVKVHELGLPSSKFPPAFAIDLHIDDSVGVQIEGEKYNFKTLIIHENDERWTEIVISSIHRMQQSKLRE